MLIFWIAEESFTVETDFTFYSELDQYVVFTVVSLFHMSLLENSILVPLLEFCLQLATAKST